MIFRRRPLPPPAALPQDLRGPMSEEYVRELQRRLVEKRAAAIAELGERWLFHPSRRMR